MAYIDAESLRNRLPREGQGITDEEVQEAIDSAIEEVSGVTDDSTGESALTRQAVASLAQADCLDIIFPRDARTPEAEQGVLRLSAERKLLRFLDNKRNKEGDQDVTTGDVPSVKVRTFRIPPTHFRHPDQTY